MTLPSLGDEPAALLIGTTHGPSGPCLHLAGELDIATGPGLLDAVAALGGQAPVAGERLDVDLADLSFVDAAGLDALVRAQELARAGGRRTRVTGARPLATVLLEITGLVSVVDVVQPTPMRLVAQAARGEAREAALELPQRDLGMV